MVEREFYNRPTAVEFKLKKKKKYIFLEESQNEYYSKVFQNIKRNLAWRIDKNVFILTVVIDSFLECETYKTHTIILVIIIKKDYSQVMHC